MSVTNVSAFMERVNSGELRLVAVTGDSRMEELPDVPTLDELGYPEADYVSTQALTAPAETPEDIQETLRQLTLEAMQTDSYQEFLQNTYTTLPDMTGEEWLNEYTREEYERLGRSYEELGILE